MIDGDSGTTRYNPEFYLVRLLCVKVDSSSLQLSIDCVLGRSFCLNYIIGNSHWYAPESMLYAQDKYLYDQLNYLRNSRCFGVDLSHCLKIVPTWSFSGPHFPAFKLNTMIYSVNLYIQSQCRDILTRRTPNTGTLRKLNV